MVAAPAAAAGAADSETVTAFRTPGSFGLVVPPLASTWMTIQALGGAAPAVCSMVVTAAPMPVARRASVLAATLVEAAE
jgi:hypothetical protein